MKNSADQGGCYPQRPKVEGDNTLRDLQNSSYPTQPHSIIANYYMASSLSRQDEPIARCDWLPERARWSAHSGLPAVSRKKNFPESHIINPYWPSLFGQDGWILA